MWKRYAALFAAVYIIFLILMLPAQSVWRWTGVSDAQINLEHVSGTLWSGSAEVIPKAGVIIPVKWRFRPLVLLRGALGFALQSTMASLPLTLHISKGLSGQWRLDDIRGEGSAADIARLLGINGLIDGRVRLDIDQLLISTTGIEQAGGNISWRNAEAGISGPVALGDLTLELGTDTGKLTGRLGDSGGPLLLQGRIDLSLEGRYDFRAKLGARGDQNGDLKALLQLFGRPGRDGYQNLQYSGAL